MAQLINVARRSPMKAHRLEEDPSFRASTLVYICVCMYVRMGNKHDPQLLHHYLQEHFYLMY